MNWEQLKGLKFYIAYAVIIVGFFIYSGLVGLKWLNSTQTEKSGPQGARHGTTGNMYRYHYHK